MSDAIEKTPNIGEVLGGRLRQVGIQTRAELDAVGDEIAFSRLVARYPEDACTHTRLALAGAVRGVRWHALPAELRAELARGLK